MSARRNRSKGVDPVRLHDGDGPPSVGEFEARLPTLAALWWCIAAGVLIFTSFPFRPVPESGLWPLTWFGLAPLLWALTGASPKRAFWYGFVTGLVTNFGGFWWVETVLFDFGHLPASISWGVSFLNASWQALQFALFAWVLARVRRAPFAGALLTATVFTAIEFIFPMIFPWYFGNAQYRFPIAIQVAELGGPSAVTFVVVLVNGLIARGVRTATGHGPWRSIDSWVATALVIGAFVFGGLRIQAIDAQAAAARKLTVGVVEANIGIWEKEARGLSGQQQALTLHKNLLLHQKLSAELADRGAELIIWPESSYFPWGKVRVKASSVFAMGVSATGQTAALEDPGPNQPMRWTLQAGAGAPLNAIAAGGESAIVAVGAGGRILAGRPESLIEVPGAGPRAATLNAVAVVRSAARTRRANSDIPALRFWAVGDAGALVTGTEKGRSTVPSTTQTSLHGITLLRDGDGWAVGDAGTIVALEDGAVASVTMPTNATLRAIVSLGRGDALALGDGGVVLRTERGKWTAEDSGTTADLHAAVVLGRTVWAVGAAGTIRIRSRDGTWRARAFPTREDLRAIATDAHGILHIAGADGGLWRESSAGVWAEMPRTGLGVLRGLVSVPYDRATPIPRDARYLAQSDAPLTDPELFLKSPSTELARPTDARTAVQRGFKTPILFGGVTWTMDPPPGRPNEISRYNTAVLLDEMGRIRGTYDKMKLLAFGEYMPFGAYFPVLYEWIPESSGFSAGDRVVAIEHDDYRVGVLVCYEDILPAASQALSAEKPNILINITNDAWFGTTAEPYLHMALSTFRAVELRVPMIRATNTGVSVVIDPVGRVTARTSIYDAETLLAEVPLMPGGTLYGRIGDAFAYGLWVLLVCLALVRRRRE